MITWNNDFGIFTKLNVSFIPIVWSAWRPTSTPPSSLRWSTSWPRPRPSPPCAISTVRSRIRRKLFRIVRYSVLQETQKCLLIFIYSQLYVNGLKTAKTLIFVGVVMDFDVFLVKCYVSLVMTCFCAFLTCFLTLTVWKTTNITCEKLHIPFCAGIRFRGDNIQARKKQSETTKYP